VITLIAGGGFSAVTSLIIALVTTVVGGAVGGLIIAFVYHPVFKFIIDKLFKGHSTMQSRTNFLAISQSVGILSRSPAASRWLSAALVGLIAPHLPRLAAFIPIVPSLISLACTLISVLMAYRWFHLLPSSQGGADPGAGRRWPAVLGNPAGVVTASRM